MTRPVHLVVGAAGDVGAAVVDALLARGARVRVLVRATLPRTDGVEVVTGDLGDRASLDRALDGAAGAFFITPHHPDERQLGLGFVDACEAAGVARLVYSAAVRPMSRLGVVDAVLDRVTGILGPHYRAKLAVARRVRRSRLSPVVLLPSNFYQNDELGLPEILDGRYPHPLGTRRMNRVDTRDIGDAAARALVDPGVASGVYPLVGPDDWTGPAAAAVWSAALGREVVYAGDDLDAWRRTIGARMTPAKAADFGRTYRVIQRMGFRAPRWMHARATEILGRPARGYPDYVREVAQKAGRMPYARAS